MENQEVMANKQHRGFTSALENRISTLLKAVSIPHPHVLRSASVLERLIAPTL